MFDKNLVRVPAENRRQPGVGIAAAIEDDRAGDRFHNAVFFTLDLEESPQPVDSLILHHLREVVNRHGRRIVFIKGFHPLPTGAASGPGGEHLTKSLVVLDPISICGKARINEAAQSISEESRPFWQFKIHKLPLDHQFLSV